MSSLSIESYIQNSTIESLIASLKIPKGEY